MKLVRGDDSVSRMLPDNKCVTSLAFLQTDWREELYPQHVTLPEKNYPALTSTIHANWKQKADGELITRVAASVVI